MRDKYSLQMPSTSQNSNMMTMLMNMLMNPQNMNSMNLSRLPTSVTSQPSTSSQSPFLRDYSSITLIIDDVPDDLQSPQSAPSLLKMMKAFGLDKLTTVNTELLLKFHLISSIPSDRVAQTCSVDCPICGETHSSIYVSHLLIIDY